MNKSKFLELVKNPESIEEYDLAKLEALAVEHPYSQVLHVLNVKAQKSYGKDDFEKALHLAATYVYDRNLLHTLIEGEIDPATITPVPEEATDETADLQEEVSDFDWINEVKDDDVDPAKVNEFSPAEPPVENAEPVVTDQDQPPATSDSEETELPPAAAEENIAEETKQEDQEAESSSVTTEEEATSTEAEESAEPEVEEEKANIDTTETVTAELKEISESLEELADEELAAAESSKEKESKETEEKDAPAEVKTNGEESLNLEIEAGSIHAELMENLNQLQESKQQYESPTEEVKDPQHRQEQIEIIDNFIKNSPVLSKPNLSADSEAETQDDLSKKSTKLSEELVSENLAKIYLKQGKRKDAEKIYKKLIRKFPQKKGYFADQIEKIKKKK